jgi:hypothetical protein
MTLTIALLCCHQVQAQDNDCYNNSDCTAQQRVHAWIEQAQQTADPDPTVPPSTAGSLFPLMRLPSFADSPYGRCWYGLQHRFSSYPRSKEQELARDVGAEMDQQYESCKHLSDQPPAKGLRRRP